MYILVKLWSRWRYRRRLRIRSRRMGEDHKRGAVIDTSLQLRLPTMLTSYTAHQMCGHRFSWLSPHSEAASLFFHTPLPNQLTRPFSDLVLNLEPANQLLRFLGILRCTNGFLCIPVDILPGSVDEIVPNPTLRPTPPL